MLEELRTLAPLLLIGQQVTLEADQQLRLSGVDEQELATMLAAVNAPTLSTVLQQRLLTITRGNPRSSCSLPRYCALAMIRIRH
ncbi:MAG: hypothetical protein R2867_17920 [Caldilineaceae bacterium]